jgi:lipopolysaccharide transport protein LptA/LPS export ABC transporter protein LptC
MATTSNFGTEQEWAQPDPFGGTTAADRARNLVRARRHTRVVQALRFSLPGAAAGIVVLYFGMIIDTTGWVGSFPKLELPRILPDNLTMDNPSYEGFNKDGGKYVVRAKTAIQDLVNTEFVRLNDITGDMTDVNKSKTNLTAAKGEFNTKTNHLELTGGIDIVADSGLKAKLSTATIETNENIITSKEPVLVEMPSGTIRSNEMRILSKSREIAFVNDVKAHLVPPKPDAAAENAPTPVKPAATPMFGGGEGPIDITANRLDIDDTDKTATFTGNVKARQGDAAMATAALEVQYEGGDTGASGSAPAVATPGAGTKIKRIFSKSPVVMTRAPQERVTGASFDYDAVKQVAVVNGDVEMTSGADRSATGERATVDQQADTILLTGGVVAMQGRNQLKGERLFVERATGKTQLSSPGSAGEQPGRISTRFYRGEEKAQTPKQKVQQLAAEATKAAATGAVGVFKTDPTAPIDVEAGRLDVDDRSKQALFKSDVRAVQGDFVVRTSELRAYYTGAAGLAEDDTAGEKKAPAEITRIEARGAVIVTSKNGQNATGDWADFNVKENQIVLGGDVILTQGKNVVRGSKLTIDMLTGESVIHNDPSAAWSATAAPVDKKGQGFTIRPGTASRPSAIFYPHEKKADEKKPSGAASDGAGASGPDGGWSARSPRAEGE